MAFVKMDREGYYAYIGVNDKQDYEYYTLLADTNVAINCEKYYYCPHTLSETKRLATKDFLIDNIDKDPVYGFALQESCWDYVLKTINIPQYRKMENALVSEYEWSKEYIINHMSTKGIDYEGTVKREAIGNIVSLVDQFTANPTMILSYASVLKIMLLEKKYKRQSKKAIEEFIDFVDNILFCDNALEMQLAIYYFLGKDDSYQLGNALFKFDKKKINVLQKAWNTCWDLFYLRMLQRSYYLPTESGSVSPKLVTADKGLITFAELCSLEATIDYGNNTILPIISFRTYDIQDEFQLYTDRIAKRLLLSSYERVKKSSNVDQEYIINIIRKLEVEIMKYS